MQRIHLIAALLFVGMAACHAQVPPTYHVPFSAVDDHGQQVEDITTADVQLQAGGERANVLAVRRYHNAPVRMIIVLDDSGSMGIKNKWTITLIILRALLLSLPPGSSVGLIGVQEGQFEVIRHPDAIVNYVNNIAKRDGGPHGQTPLFDAIHRAVQELPQPRPSDVIFIISDGGDDKSKTTKEQLGRELAAAGVRVTGTVVTSGDEFPPEMAIGPDALADMFRDFAGWDGISEPFFRQNATLKPDSPGLKAFLTTLYDFYVADFTLASPVSKPPRIKLRVRGVEPRHKGKMLVTSLDRLPAAGATVVPAASHP